MIKIEHIEVFNLEGAIRGMRNPMNSWDKSDSLVCKGVGFEDCISNCNTCPRKDEDFNADAYCVGKNDLDLMRKLYRAGHPHRKYLRQILVSMDITAPRTWWNEFDTYKVGVTRDSCSTMHKIHVKEFDINDFSHDDLETLSSSDSDAYNTAWQHWCDTIKTLNYFRDKFNSTTSMLYWRMLIDALPQSYNQKATVTCNYENIVNMLQYRSDHKLSEWREFCRIMLDKLPYLNEIIGD